MILSACSVDLAGDITPPPALRATSSPQTKTNNLDYPLVSPDVAQGAQIYSQYCSPCHGATGKGTGQQARNFSIPVIPIGQPDLARASIPSQWYQIVTNGEINRFMPGFITSLNDRQRWNVLAYVYSLSMTDSLLAQGKKVYDTNCADCHGPSGKGNGIKSANLSQPVPNFTSQDLLTQKSDNDLFLEIKQGIGGSQPNGMPSFSDKLSDVDTWAVTTYIRALTFSYVPELELASSNSSISGATAMISRATSNTTAITSSPNKTVAQVQVTTSAENQPTGVGSTTTVVTGSVQGKIILPGNMTLPSSLSVNLLGFDSTLQQMSSVTAPVRPDGTFLFTNVEMPSGQVFMTTVIINNVTFNSNVSSAADGTNLDLPITIYDSSTDATPLVVDHLHVFLDFSTSTGMQVTELYVISNPTDKVIVSNDGKPILSFALPPNATNLQFETGTAGQRYILTNNGFGDTQPVLPGNGQNQEWFTFDMPYGKRLDLSLPITLPVSAASVILPINGVSLVGNQLAKSGLENVQGQNYQVYSASNLSPGSFLEMTLSGSPGSAISNEPQGSFRNILIGGGVLVIALVIAGLFIARKRRQEEDIAEQPEISDEMDAACEEDATSLIEAIAALDDLYKAGKIPASAYQQRRAEMKARLKKIVQETGMRLP